MASAKKPSAASRTVDMFAPPKPIDERPVEAVEEDEKAERIPMELAADGYRARALEVQAWATDAFGSLDAPSSQYRVSKSWAMYYLESLPTLPGSKGAYAYHGLMVHERDLLAITAVLVQAVREKQKRDANGK